MYGLLHIGQVVNGLSKTKLVKYMDKCKPDCKVVVVFISHFRNTYLFTLIKLNPDLFSKRGQNMEGGW